MQYISQLNAFYSWMDSHPLSSNDIALWQALMHIANKARWPKRLTVALSTLESKAGMKKDAIYRSRKRLFEAGRIIVHPHSSGRASEYEIIPFEEGYTNALISSQNESHLSAECVGKTEENADTSVIVPTNPADLPTQNATIATDPADLPTQNELKHRTLIDLDIDKDSSGSNNVNVITMQRNGNNSSQIENHYHDSVISVQELPPEMRDPELAETIQFWVANYQHGVPISPAMGQKIIDRIERLPGGIVRYALDLGLTQPREGIANWGWICRKLDDYERSGVRTLEQAEAKEKARSGTPRAAPKPFDSALDKMREMGAL